ncbi:MAG: SPOR domain-containing protein [Syntrophobacteraceae bacterium]
MTRPKLVVINSEQTEQAGSSRGGKKYRFELSRKKLILYTLSLIATLCWMFIFGVLVGRGVALVSSDDFSARAEFMRFLGLGKQTGEPAAKAAETWGDPKKILESLNYYEDLTQKGGTPLEASPKPVEPAEPAPSSEPVKVSGKETVSRRTQSQPQPEKTAVLQAEKSPGQAAPAPPGEQYTLLVASLKDPENAQRLVDQLKSKGYSPRLEALDLNGGGRWNRVLVGSFASREAAIKFAAEFNKKEKVEGLVIREPN